MTDITILVVDDDPAHLELIVDALAQCCPREYIGTAPDGVEALDFLLGRAGHAERDVRRQPRLVVLDMKLLRMHGVEVLRAMRSDPLTRSVPVVMLSASTEKEALDACYEAGANSVVRKTSDHDELRRKMRQVHDFWITVNEGDRHSRV